MTEPFPSASSLMSDRAAGHVSPEELMLQTLDRIDAVNPTVNAIVSLQPPDALLAEARNARSDRPLAGLPIAIKDHTATAGIPTTHGSPLFADNVTTYDDRITRVLKSAGAIVIGKTNMPEFGLGSHTFNPVFGATLNPYDLSVTAGGSSGGAAVAIATGMLPMADGSDMMGSLRNPAAWNNVYGLRPSAGTIPRDPGPILTLPLSTDGPMARHPEDLALMLKLMATAEPGALQIGALQTASLTDFDGLRIGWIGDTMGLPFEDGLSRICRTALLSMAEAGAITQEIPVPYDREMMWTSWTTLRACHIAQSQGADFDDPARRDHIKKSAQWEIETGRATTRDEHQKAELDRARVFAAIDLSFNDWDVLAMPATQVWPFPVNQEYPEVIAGQSMDTYHRWMEVMLPSSLTGMPSISLPVGFNENGLPAGIQLVARRGRDLDLIALANAWDVMTGWVRDHPPALA